MLCVLAEWDRNEIFTIKKDYDPEIGILVATAASSDLSTR
jgi:hypothetical protein